MRVTKGDKLAHRLTGRLEGCEIIKEELLDLQRKCDTDEPTAVEMYSELLRKWSLGRSARIRSMKTEASGLAWALYERLEGHDECGPAGELPAIVGGIRTVHADPATTELIRDLGLMIN